MRQGIWVVLALTVFVIGAGILVVSAGWLLPAVSASATTLPVESSTSSTLASTTSPEPIQPMDMTAAVSEDDSEIELTTFTKYGHDCNVDKSASAGGY